MGEVPTPAVIQTDLSEVRAEEEAGHGAGEATSAAGAAGVSKNSKKIVLSSSL